MIQWKQNRHNFVARRDGEYVGLVSVAPPETWGSGSWNAAFHTEDGGLIGLGSFPSPEPAQLALEHAVALGWTYEQWDSYKAFDRYGERVLIGDVVDILFYLDTSEVMGEAVVVGFDPAPEYAPDDFGLHVWTEDGWLSSPIWRGLARYKHPPRYNELPTWLHFAGANARMGLRHFKEAIKYKKWIHARWGLIRLSLATREAFWHFEQRLALATMVLLVVALAGWGVS